MSGETDADGTDGGVSIAGVVFRYIVGFGSHTIYATQFYRVRRQIIRGIGVVVVGSVAKCKTVRYKIIPSLAWNNYICIFIQITMTLIYYYDITMAEVTQPLGLVGVPP